VKSNSWRGSVSIFGVASTIAAGLALPHGTQAQSSDPMLVAQTGERRAFNIPPQPLGTALGVLGQQSGRNISVDGALVRGLSTQGVQGTMTIGEALDRLLSGTGLTYSMPNNSTITVQRPGAGSGTVLDPVRVQGTAPPPQSEIGNLPPAYAGGEVARGGRIGLLGNRDYMDTPFSTTSYTEKYIQDVQARTFIDVMANDPTVRPVYGAGQYDDRVFIRGFFLNTSDMAFNGLYGVTPVIAVPMAGIERVEVFRGPNAMLNGMAPRGAVGGTINFVPKRAPEAGIAQATALYSMNGNFGGQLDYGRRFGPDNAMGVRANAYFTGGPTAVNNQSDSLLNLTLGVDYRSPDTRLDFDIGYVNRNTIAPQSGLFLQAGLLLPPAPNATGNFYQPWEFGWSKTTYGMLRFEHDFAENLTGFAKVGGSRTNGAYVYAYPTMISTTGATTATPSKGVNYNENASVDAGLRGRFQTGPLKHEAVVSGSYLITWNGAATNNTPVVASNIYAPIVQPAPNLTGFPQGAPTTSQSVLSSVGLIDALSALDDKVQLIGGVRLQQVQVANWNATTGLPTPGYAQSAVTPTVSLIVKPWDQLSFYGNFIQALEQGTIARAGLANAGAVFPPFVSTQYEVGTKLDLGNFGATLSLFQITKPSTFVNPATNSLVQNGQQQNSGLEFTMFGEPIKGLRPLGGFSFLSPVLTQTVNGTNNGHYAPGVPTFQANLGVDWDIPWVKGLTVGSRIIYTGQTFMDPANLQPVPAWTRVDLSAKYIFERPDGKLIGLRAQLLNAGNNNFWMATNGYVTQGQPRTLMLSLTADF